MIYIVLFIDDWREREMATCVYEPLFMRYIALCRIDRKERERVRGKERERGGSIYMCREIYVQNKKYM